MRPGFVLEVDERTPPLLVHSGDGVLLERFPLGTRVVYPPQPRGGVESVDAAIGAALDAPVGESAPLAALLRPGMRLAISVQDLTAPSPRMRGRDVRGRILERVLSLAAAAGVDEVTLVVAGGLNRRLSAAEVARLVGERVFRSFWPQRLVCHDAEDIAGLVEVGTAESGEALQVARVVAQADLLVAVEVVQTPGAGGAAGLVGGLSSYASLRGVRGVAAVMRDAGLSGSVSSGSLVDGSLVDGPAADGPAAGDGGSAAARLGAVLGAAVPVFAVTATVNLAVGPAGSAFLTRREWEWSLADQAMAFGVGRGMDLLAGRVRRRALRELAADYAITSVTAGEVSAVSAAAWAQVLEQQAVEVPGQADVLVVGSAPFGPYHGSGPADPVLAAHGALAGVFGGYRGVPVVRENGAMIVYHPMAARFSQLHQPSYVDFYEEVLAESSEPATIEAKFERQYATDPWYTSLYQTSLALHGVHPFHRWYETAPARGYLGEVVFVGGNRAVCARLGFRAASTLADALEIVSGSVGRDPSIAYVHSPPGLVAQVR
ncbi:lactate racemase domain-containing protein [Frankia sp. AgKG'84/4]|uniref:lactate racemase domain-containing protein n=1 Tax=Frankia sp. AgKG'84/4 TaxID=573490 RepID=UPI00200FAB48|nr:lactate racemase domain-containing protein [Frankia sp. AgKG'84/4]MCL9793997.1 nickel-dependent lactate racemase [Frankia sp. AgKG'84/4]